MLGADTLQYFLIALVVSGMTLVGTRQRKLKYILLWGLVTAFIPVLILNILLPSETVKAELYWFWDTPSFLIKSFSLAIFIGILALGAGLAARLISVRWGKSKWIGVIGGIGTALVLIVPAMIASLLVACVSGDCL